MKKVIILIIISFCSFKLYSQDLIITDRGDSIICVITKVKKDNIYFLWKSNNEIRNSFLPTSRIIKYKYNYIPKSKTPIEKKSNNEEFKPLQFSFDGGYSFRIGKLDKSVPESLKSYYHKLQSGFNIGAGISYYFDKTFGIGVKFHSFLTSNSMENAYLKSPTGQMKYGTLSDKLNISFVGPSFSLRTIHASGQSSFYSNYYAGYIHYRDDAISLVPYYITGSTIGLGTDVGWDLELSENFLLGFQASLIAGSLNKFRIDDGSGVQTINLEKGNYESLYRIDFSIGIRFK